MKSLVDNNVMITGAASGIGRQMARLFAKEKSNLAIIDINETALKETVEELSQYPVRVHPYRCDLSKKEEIEDTARKIKDDFDQVDILVNNAGVISGRMIADLSYEEIKRTFDVNLMAVIWMTKQFLPEMMSRNSGYIVNISSGAGFVAAVQMGDYCASKAGSILFSDSLRREFQKIGCRNVKVLVVCPGLTDTGMFKGLQQPWYFPPLRPEYVAGKVIEAIRREKALLMLPAGSWVVLLIRLLPVSWQDRIFEMMGAGRAMDHFVGRRDEKV
jgi:short-subunit dehydrogenase